MSYNYLKPVDITENNINGVRRIRRSSVIVPIPSVSTWFEELEKDTPQNIRTQLKAAKAKEIGGIQQTEKSVEPVMKHSKKNIPLMQTPEPVASTSPQSGKESRFFHLAAKCDSLVALLPTSRHIEERRAWNSKIHALEALLSAMEQKLFNRETESRDLRMENARLHEEVAQKVVKTWN